jgi:TolB-like protein
MAASAQFAGSDRMVRLLRYVVDRTLAGEAEQLKEYVLGVEVFDRDQRYDPRIDSIVRVEARRLRNKLDEYYSGPGVLDELVIAMPKGSYVPEFTLRTVGTDAPSPPPSVDPASVAAAETAPRRMGMLRAGLGFGLLGGLVLMLVASLLWRDRNPVADLQAHEAAASIIVLPFQAFTDLAEPDGLAAKLTDQVTTHLARLGTLSVVSYRTATRVADGRGSLREIAREVGADLVLEASIERRGGAIAVEARLVNGVTDRKVWVQRFEAGPEGLASLPRDIAESVSAAVATRTPQSRQ